MQIETLSRSYQKAFAANLVATSFASCVATTTEPTGNGVIDLTAGGPGGGAGGIVPQYMMVLPYGLGASNDGFSLRIIGWRRCNTPLGAATSVLTLWVPTTFVEVACLLGASTGVAGASVLNTECFCDTITPVAARLPDRVIAAGTALNSDVRIINLANDEPAFLVTPLFGFEKIKFLGDTTNNTPSMNALLSFF